MNRRSFFSKLAAGLLAAPVIANVIAEPKMIYFRGDEYLKVAPFKMDGQQTVWIRAEFETGKTTWSLDGKEWVSGSAPDGSLIKSYELGNGLSLRQDDPRFMPMLYSSGAVKV